MVEPAKTFGQGSAGSSAPTAMHSPGLEHIEFFATVPTDMRGAVEALFFFNPRQDAVLPRIQAAMDRTGPPRLAEANGKVWIDVASRTTQCLFACDLSKGTCLPVGVILFGRPAHDVIWIAHIAVAPAYTMNHRVQSEGLAGLLIRKVKEVASRIKGVTRIELPYQPGSYAPLKPGGEKDAPP
jgi:hypothetical protein